jgi:hypothetical protein
MRSQNAIPKKTTGFQLVIVSLLALTMIACEGSKAPEIASRSSNNRPGGDDVDGPGGGQKPTPAIGYNVAVQTGHLALGLSRVFQTLDVFQLREKSTTLEKCQADTMRTTKATDSGDFQIKLSAQTCGRRWIEDRILDVKFKTAEPGHPAALDEITSTLGRLGLTLTTKTRNSDYRVEVANEVIRFSSTSTDGQMTFAYDAIVTTIKDPTETSSSRGNGRSRSGTGKNQSVLNNTVLSLKGSVDTKSKAWILNSFSSDLELIGSGRNPTVKTVLELADIGGSEIITLSSCGLPTAATLDMIQIRALENATPVRYGPVPVTIDRNKVSVTNSGVSLVMPNCAPSLFLVTDVLLRVDGLIRREPGKSLQPANATKNKTIRPSDADKRPSDADKKKTNTDKKDAPTKK